MRTLLKSGLVYTMENDKAQVLDILVEEGKIVDIDNNIDVKSNLIIDCKNKVVLPGLIDSHCHIGVFGTAMGERGVDGNEDSSSCTPELRAIDGINPFDPEFEHAYKHGVTCVSTGPGSANPIAGQFAILKTYGKTFDDMIIKEPSAMKMAFGENPKSSHKGAAPVTRMGTAAIIREALFKAKRYADDIREARDKGRVLPAFDMKLEALVPVVEGDLQVKAHAHRADDILTALRIAKEFNLRMSIEHCSEGHFIPEQLIGAEGVIIGPLLGFPHKLEVANQSPIAAKIFYEKGIKFAIMSDLPATHSSDIILAAGACIREGLPMKEALKALTIGPAQILGIDDNVGSIKVGKDADIVVFDKNPLEEVSSKCLLTMIDGQIVHNEME